MNPQAVGIGASPYSKPKRNGYSIQNEMATLYKTKLIFYTKRNGYSIQNEMHPYGFFFIYLSYFSCFLCNTLFNECLKWYQVNSQ